MYKVSKCPYILLLLLILKFIIIDTFTKKFVIAFLNACIPVSTL